MERYEKYKDSGIEWIGEIPEQWDIKKIKHRCYVKGRVGWKGLKSSEFLNDGFSYLVTGTDFKNDTVDWANCYHIDEERYNEDPYIQLQNEDLLITKDGTIGKLAVVANLDKPACLNSGIFVVRSIKDDFSTRYLLWVLKSSTFTDFNGLTAYGSTIQHLYQNVFVEFSFTFPPVKTQIFIADYLRKKTAEIDQIIANKQKLITFYEEEKQTIINQAVTKGLDPNVKLKDSGVEWLGEIPEHWEVKKIKRVFNFLDSKRIPLSSEERGKIIEKTYDYYGASGVIDQVDNYIFDGDYILIGEDGANLLTRSCPLAFKASGKFWVNNHAHILEPIEGILDFWVYYLENIDYAIWVSGSAQPKLTGEALGAIPIAVPPQTEQTKITEFIIIECDRLNTIISKYNKQIDLLQEYRTTLISEVVTGKIKVSNTIEA